MIGPFSRIFARWLASALVTYGLMVAPDAAAIEPDLIVIIGGLLGATTEAVYALARRRGWAT